MYAYVNRYGYLLRLPIAISTVHQNSPIITGEVLLCRHKDPVRVETYFQPAILTPSLILTRSDSTPRALFSSVFFSSLPHTSRVSITSVSISVSLLCLPTFRTPSDSLSCVGRLACLTFSVSKTSEDARSALNSQMSESIQMCNG